MTTNTIIKSELGITVSSLDKAYKRFMAPFARLLGKYAFADETPEIFKGNNFTHEGVAYAPARMKTTRALKRRFINFWRRYQGRDQTAIMMIDIDEAVSPDIWATAGLPVPFVTNTNPASGHCQIIWMMDKLVDKIEYYQIRDSMLNELCKFGVKVDYSKPENMRSPFFDPFIGKSQEKKRKRASGDYIKRGKVQADYTAVTVYDWTTYDPEDLYRKQPDLNNIDFDPDLSIDIAEIKTVARMKVTAKSEVSAGSITLFDKLREACYPMYSKKDLWGFDCVLSIARQLGVEYSEKKIMTTATEVFYWIEREFPKSHDPSKASGKGGIWASIRWSKARRKKECLVDFAVREGFSRQYASQLNKSGDIYEQFGRYFYTKNKIDDPDIYMRKFHVGVKDGEENGTVIYNKHVNQGDDDSHLFEDMNLMEVEIEPPIPPPKVMMALGAMKLVELWD